MFRCVVLFAVQCGLVLCVCCVVLCVVWCGVVWCGVVWCCVVLCGVVWCCVVLCVVVCVVVCQKPEDTPEKPTGAPHFNAWTHRNSRHWNWTSRATTRRNRFLQNQPLSNPTLTQDEQLKERNLSNAKIPGISGPMQTSKKMSELHQEHRPGNSNEQWMKLLNYYRIPTCISTVNETPGARDGAM